MASAQKPPKWGLSNINLQSDSSAIDQPGADHALPATSDNPAEAVLALGRPSPSPGPKGTGGTNLLGAVATLLALTPRGRTEELTRLSALAHGYIGIASDEELIALAKAVASRDDINSGLADRLAGASDRAAHTLIRANRLSDEGVAKFLEHGDDQTRQLIARHHTLKGKHITALVAEGSGAILQALLENRQTDFAPDTQQLVESRVAALTTLPSPDQNDGAPEPVANPTDRATLSPTRAVRSDAGTDPRAQAHAFAEMDAAGRRAVVRRLAEDRAPHTDLTQARRALDPTRRDADLAFLTVLEQRDPAALAALFAQTLALDGALVGRLLDEADGDALLVLAKAADLSSTAFARMLILGKTGLTGSPRDTFVLVDRFNDLPLATAQMIVESMRQGARRQPPAPDRQARRPAATAPSLPAAAPARPKARSITRLAGQGFRKAM